MSRGTYSGLGDSGVNTFGTAFMLLPPAIRIPQGADGYRARLGRRPDC